MKKNILALAVASALTAMPVWADNNDTASVGVGGLLVADLVANTPTNLTMPNLVHPDPSEDTFVILDCDPNGTNVVFYDAVGGNPFAHGTAAAAGVAGSSANKTPGDETGTCGVVNVGGQDGFYYTITATVGTDISPDTGMSMTSPVCKSTDNSSSSSQGLLTGGNDVLSCGAKVTADETATAGNYGTEEIDVAVVYD